MITPSELSYFRESPFGIFSQKTISLNKLQNIRLSHAEELVIESDTTSISIGRLGDQQLLWLERFILSAIITAPKWPDRWAQRKNDGR